MQQKKISPRTKIMLVPFLVALFGIFFWGSSSVLASCEYPAQVLDLKNWKLTLPTGSSEKPTEIKQSALATYKVNTFFQPSADCGSVVFRAPVNGVTTSGSGYPRSELREMSNGGKSLASWSTTQGVHTMFLDGAITAVPSAKKHVVFGQIHDSEDDVIVVRLEYPKLFIDINGNDGPVLDANYKLGKRFTVKFEAQDGKIAVYYNGSATPAYVLNKKSSGNYFKAGAYTQSNCSKEKKCDVSNFGEVAIYKLLLNQEDVSLPLISPSTEPVVSIQSVTLPPGEQVRGLPDAASTREPEEPTLSESKDTVSENQTGSSMSDNSKGATVSQMSVLEKVTKAVSRAVEENKKFSLLVLDKFLSTLGNIIW